MSTITQTKPSRFDEPIWQLVRSKPNMERVAHDAIKALGVAVYLPCFLRNTVHAGVARLKAVALFPGYLFAQDGFFRQVRSAHGVSDVLHRETGPITVLDEWIRDLRSREGADGYINLNALEAAEPPPVVYVEGEKLRIVNPESSFSGTLVKFVQMRDKDRALVSAHMFKGRRFPMTVGLNELERVARVARVVC